jgi:cobalt/nickel transport system permease protein
MAHLVDGVVSAPVLLGGAALAAAGIALGLRRLHPDRVPHVGVLSAAFFVASLVHIPVGPASAHLLMNGLAGILLGWAAVPAIFVALVLQAVFFGYGGVTVLGINTLIVSLPAVLSYYLFARAARSRSAFFWGGAAGAFAVAATCAGIALALSLSGTVFVPAAKLIAAAHLPVMIVETFITGAVLAFLQRVKPEVLAVSRPLPSS